MEKQNARLRREYLYKKSLAKRFGESGDNLRETGDTREALVVKDVRGIDDEYATAGISDPRVLLTTSRDPSTRLVQFVKELREVIPNADRMNRGHSSIQQLVETARQRDLTDLILLHETRGNPDGLIVCHLPHGPTAFFGISGLVMRHDLTEDRLPSSSQYPHLVFDNLTSPIGRRLMDILKFLFPVTPTESARVVTFSNRNDYLSFRNHTYKAEPGGKDIVLTELGPRFDLRPYQIKLGTLDMKFAENEFVLRPYLSNAKRKQYFGESIQGYTDPRESKDDDDDVVDLASSPSSSRHGGRKFRK